MNLVSKSGDQDGVFNIDTIKISAFQGQDWGDNLLGDPIKPKTDRRVIIDGALPCVLRVHVEVVFQKFTNNSMDTCRTWNFHTHNDSYSVD